MSSKYERISMEPTYSSSLTASTPGTFRLHRSSHIFCTDCNSSIKLLESTTQPQVTLSYLKPFHSKTLLVESTDTHMRVFFFFSYLESFFSIVVCYHPNNSFKKTSYSLFTTVICSKQCPLPLNGFCFLYKLPEH